MYRVRQEELPFVGSSHIYLGAPHPCRQLCDTRADSASSGIRDSNLVGEILLSPVYFQL